MAEAQIDKLSIEIETNADNATSSIEKLAKSFSNLASKGNFGKISDGMNKVSVSITKTSSAFELLKNKIAQVIGIQAAWNVTIQSSRVYSEYTEDVNLFAVAMGNCADEAAEFAEKMENVLGVNSGDAMRNMATFQNLTTSFGMASDRAYVLSKNLTQLGYDMASLYNISTEDSFQKLQAAISGELEPIRRLGVDISNTRLQQELYNLGINESVNNLTQADKAQLRYIAIMKQTINAQTDMGRTLNSPANQFRVLSAQISLLARNLGALLIPAVNAVLPYMIALVQVIQKVIGAIARLFGAQISWADFSDGASSAVSSTGAVSGGLDDVGDSAASAAKEVHDLIGGFDELNVAPDQSSGSGSGVDAGGGTIGDIELPSYDMFANLVDSNVTKIVKKLTAAFEKLWKVLEPFSPLIEGIGAALAAAFATKVIYDFIKSFKKIALFTNIIEVLRQGMLGFNTAFEAGEGVLKSFKAGLAGFRAAIPMWAKLATAVGVAVGSFVTAYQAFKKAATGASELSTAIGLAVAGLTIFGTVGYAVLGTLGLVIAAIGTLTGAYIGWVQGVNESADTIYKASEYHKKLQESIEGSESAMQQAADNLQTMNEKITALGEIGDTYNGVRDLVNQIFDLSEKTGKTAGDIAELQGLVDTLNAKNIEGLQLEFNETTGTVKGTRDEVLKLISELEQAAYIAALQQVITSAVQAKLEAEKALSDAQTDIVDAQNTVTEANAAFNQMREDLGSFGAGLAALGIGEHAQQWREAKDAITEANTAYSTAKDNLTAQKNALSEASENLSYYKGVLEEVENGTYSFGDSTIEAQNEFDTMFQDLIDRGIETGASVKTFATNAQTDIGSSAAASASAVQTNNTLIGSSYSAMGQQVNTTATGVSNNMDFIQKSAKTTADNVSKNMGDAADAIGKAADDVAKDLQEPATNASTWGEDIAKNFSSGFSSMWSRVSSAFSTAASWVKGIWGHSTPDFGPLKNDDEWMPDMMQNFANGIANNKNLVIRQATSLASALQNQLNAAQMSVSAQGDMNVTRTMSIDNVDSGNRYSGDYDSASNDSVVAAINALRQSIENQETDIYIDGRKVFKAVQNEARKAQIRAGQTAF